MQIVSLLPSLATKSHPGRPQIATGPPTYDTCLHHRRIVQTPTYDIPSFSVLASPRVAGVRFIAVDAPSLFYALELWVSQKIKGVGSSSVYLSVRSSISLSLCVRVSCACRSKWEERAYGGSRNSLQGLAKKAMAAWVDAMC